VQAKKTNKPYDRKVRPVTEGYLDRAALHYLGRFNSSKENLKRVLDRKVRRRNEDGGAPTGEQLGWIEAVADKCVEYGYVDDVNYAKQRFAALLRKGKPLRVISQDLVYKGVPEDIVADLMTSATDDPDKDLNLVAAAAYVRRRRFGPYRRVGAVEGKAEKEKAAMLRAGFPYRMVEQILASSEEEILSLLN